MEKYGKGGNMTKCDICGKEVDATIDSKHPVYFTITGWIGDEQATIGVCRDCLINRSEVLKKKKKNLGFGRINLHYNIKGRI